MESGGLKCGLQPQLEPGWRFGSASFELGDFGEVITSWSQFLHL